MASRDDLSLIHYQTAAKERIRWLSLRLASALSSLETRDARIAVAEAENVKLRALAEESIRLMTKYAREAGEATGKLETSELAGVVDDWKARALKAEARLAEAVGALREVLSIWDQWGSLDSTDPDDRDAMEAARQALSSVGEG